MSRPIALTSRAWNDYLYWQGQDKKTLRRTDERHRIVYAVDGDAITLPACRYHYGA